MNWALAAAAPALVGLVFWATGLIHPAIVAYHVLCAVVVWRHRTRVRTLLRADRSTLPWIAGTTLIIALFLVAAPFVHDPKPYRDVFRRTLLPWGDPTTLFALFAVYTMVIHAPLEEIFWRAVVMTPQEQNNLEQNNLVRLFPGNKRTRLFCSVAGNGAFFWLFHAVPMGMVLGPIGLLAAVPAGAAGAVWAFVTIRSQSLWPALVSHWGADGLILAGMWFFFIR
jgi:membrane protease YdiL (CAAX protease family)